MKIIIQDKDGNKIYERNAQLYELDKVLRCKDCKRFIQHYSITDDPDIYGIACCKNGKMMYVSKLECGHCAGKGVKNVKPDGRICQNFALKNE